MVFDWFNVTTKTLPPKGSVSIAEKVEEMKKSFQKVLDCKLAEGFEEIGPREIQHMRLVQVLDSTSSTITGKGTGARYLEMQTATKIRKIA